MPEETKPEETKPKDHEYVVSLPAFEGPLDLLLHLIQKHELNIFDIPVSFVTEKYLEYIRLMETLSIDVASEYLVMAATLAYIKSKSLLPNESSASDEENLDEESDIDPREELIRRLLEYQKYKQAAADLNDRGALGRDIFLRGSKVPEEVEGPAPLAPIGIWNLLDAFGKVLARAKVDLQHEISFDRMSITDRINQLLEKMAGKKTVRFEDLFDGQRTRFDIIITFLAILEMTRLKLTRLYQPDPLADIFIETVMSGAEAAAEVAAASSLSEPSNGVKAPPSEGASESSAELSPSKEDAVLSSPDDAGEDREALSPEQDADEERAAPASDTDPPTSEDAEESASLSSPEDTEESASLSSPEDTEESASLPSVEDTEERAALLPREDEEDDREAPESDTDPPTSETAEEEFTLAPLDGAADDEALSPREAPESDTDPPPSEVSESDTDPPPSDAIESGAEPLPSEATEPSV